MKCKLSTINGWCGIFNKSCKECISPKCEFIKKAYRQGRVEAEYFGYHKREWIPVSERLPREHEEVLISVRKDNGWEHVTSANFYNEKASTFFGGYDIKEVVAWQPLPKPYKGGEEND